MINIKTEYTLPVIPLTNYWYNYQFLINIFLISSAFLCALGNKKVYTHTHMNLVQFMVIKFTLEIRKPTQSDLFTFGPISCSFDSSHSKIK